jgi:hypothetical protein
MPIKSGQLQQYGLQSLYCAVEYILNEVKTKVNFRSDKLKMQTSDSESVAWHHCLAYAWCPDLDGPCPP